MVYKRKRTYAPKRGKFKKRRTTRRRRGYNSNSATRWTGGTTDTGLFRTRRVSIKKWRRQLWDATNMMTHMRSVGAQTHATATPASLITCTISFVTGDDNGVAVPWDPSGGLIGVAFQNSIVMRGGMHKITCTNDTAITTPLVLTIFGILSGDGYNPAGFPTSAPIGWEPSLFEDFKPKIGSVVCRRSYIMGNQDTVTLSYRRKIHKIDESEWIAGKRRFYWIIVSNNVETAVAQSVTVVRSFNYSLTGDQY